MKTQRAVQERRQPSIDNDARNRLLHGLPVVERRMELAGIETAVLEGGTGTPIVLLHGPGEYAAKWLRILPDLVASNRVVAPDLPGHGTTQVDDESIDAEHVIEWLGELIERTCATPPVLLGQIIGGAIAAQFASQHGDRIAQLVLVDALGMAPFQPAPEFGQALTAFMSQPTEDTHDQLWERCAFDLERMREQMGKGWERLRDYNLDRARQSSLRATQHALFGQFGMPAIPHEVLERIRVPTTLIWGRHDLATPLQVAEAASARYDWPLHVIERAADDPPMEQPEAFLRVLRTVLGDS